MADDLKHGWFCVFIFLSMTVSIRLVDCRAQENAMAFDQDVMTALGGDNLWSVDRRPKRQTNDKEEFKNALDAAYKYVDKQNTPLPLENAAVSKRLTRGKPLSDQKEFQAALTAYNFIAERSGKGSKLNRKRSERGDSSKMTTRDKSSVGRRPKRQADDKEEFMKALNAVYKNVDKRDTPLPPESTAVNKRSTLEATLSDKEEFQAAITGYNYLDERSGKGSKIKRKRRERGDNSYPMITTEDKSPIGRRPKRQADKEEFMKALNSVNKYLGDAPLSPENAAVSHRSTRDIKLSDKKEFQAALTAYNFLAERSETGSKVKRKSGERLGSIAESEQSGKRNNRPNFTNGFSDRSEDQSDSQALSPGLKEGETAKAKVVQATSGKEKRSLTSLNVGRILQTAVNLANELGLGELENNTY